VPPNGLVAGNVLEPGAPGAVIERIKVPIAFAEWRHRCVSTVDLSVVNVDINGYVRGVEVVEQIDDVIDCLQERCYNLCLG
jgi:hypothetical protein